MVALGGGAGSYERGTPALHGNAPVRHPPWLLRPVRTPEPRNPKPGTRNPKLTKTWSTPDHRCIFFKQLLKILVNSLQHFVNRGMAGTRGSSDQYEPPNPEPRNREREARETTGYGPAYALCEHGRGMAGTRGSRTILKLPS